MAKEQDIVIGRADQELEALEMDVLLRLNKEQNAKEIVNAASELDDSFIDDELREFIEDFPALDEIGSTDDE